MSKPRKHPRFLPAKMETEREKYDAYEWCKSELPGCERQAAQEHRKRHPFGATVVDDCASRYRAGRHPGAVLQHATRARDSSSPQLCACAKLKANAK